MDSCLPKTSLKCYCMLVENKAWYKSYYMYLYSSDKWIMSEAEFFTLRWAGKILFVVLDKWILPMF